jgi:diguanylate cyclase (GGDEF)-like protein
VSKTLVGSMPADAVVARIGATSSPCALPDRSAESALILLEEVRTHLASRDLPPAGRPVTVSVGVAARPPHGDTFDELLRAADRAMYGRRRRGGTASRSSSTRRW